MNKYKITIRPTSSFITELRSTTIFGGFCWAYKDLFGTKALEKMLDNLVEEKETLVFSNAFKAGHLPVPNYEKPVSGEITPIDTLIAREYDKKHNLDESRYEMHCMIDRLGEGNNQVRSELEYYSQEEYEVYVYTTLTKDVIEQTMKVLSHRGLGAKLSKGKGKFSISSIQEFAGFNETRNGYMVISDYSPKKEDSTEGSCRAKLFEGAKTFDNKTKGTYFLMEAGSYFRRKTVPAEVYGRVFRDKETNTVINGMAIAYPL